MIAVDLAEVARLTGGSLAAGTDPGTTVTGDVTVDSRATRPGGLFVCVRGEHVDGHDYAAAAVAAGAVAVVASRAVGVPAVIVDDPVAALGRLAHGVLAHADGCTVVGVTGSSGKTSTKDLLAHVFTARGSVVAPANSFNNEIGLPLTVLRVDPSTATLVAEYSARGRGHIRYLCDIARPSIAIVLNVGAAHLGEFGSRAAIADAKAELVEALEAAGTAVLNADDPLVAAMGDRTPARVLTFGRSERADVRVADLTLDEQARPRFRLETPVGAAGVTMQLHGAHHALNAAATAAAGLAADLALADIADLLSTATSRSAHRMAVATRTDGAVVVDDAYNANPESMRAALDALAAIAGERRRWAVLGEMRELGDDSDQLHRGIGEYAARTGVAELVAVGAEAVAAGATSSRGWAGRARTVTDADSATALLTHEVRGGDVVLVKASNALQLWRVADAVLAAVPAGAST